MYCRGHKIAEMRPAAGWPDGYVRVILFDHDGNAVAAKVAKSDRGALRMSDNWSRKRGACNCIPRPLGVKLTDTWY